MKNIVFVFLIMLTLACTKEENQTNENSVIFGHFYGECIGESCREIFKVEDGVLFEDLNDFYPSGSSPNDWDWIMIDQSTLSDLTTLPQFMPSEMFSDSIQVYGIPDAGDWGGYYFGLIENGVERHWLLDTQLDNMPTYMHDLANAIEDNITIINE